MSEINLKFNERVRRSQDLFFNSNPTSEQFEAYMLLLQELTEVKKLKFQYLICITDIEKRIKRVIDEQMSGELQGRVEFRNK